MKKVRFVLYLLACVGLSGCAATGPLGTAAKVANAALELSGLKQPELPESQKPPRQIAVSIAAGKNLNADSKGKPIAVLMRIYKLKEATGFYQAAFDTFVTQGRDKQELGDTLIESREITLIPDKEYSWTETVPRPAGALGFVVLFHSPSPQRWRFAFDAAKSEPSGILIGVHACALTVTRGTIVPAQNTGGTAETAPPNLLTPVVCHSQAV
ncbi:MAG: type VI secretion system lipoprotein TssJ [Burkholderiaceae bacterium]|jgi:type VI secretion system protein VasD|nr:type VI secretion system lipoprotein TssJ [Burkholderiaceae bacterium]